jgi:bacterial/archaeal transporter family protein
MPWYIFAFAAPVFYSFSVFIDKYLIEKRIKDPISLVALFEIFSGVLGIIIGLVTGFKFIGLIPTGLIMSAGMLLCFYLIPYFEALKIDEASRVVPLFQFVPVITLILSALFLKETLSIKQIMGLIIVVIAAVSLSADKIEGKLFKPRKSLWLILLSSLMYGSIGILFRYTVKGVNFWTTISYEYLGAGLAGIILFSIPKVRKGLKKDLNSIKTSLGIIALDKLGGVLAQLTEAVALTLVAVPLVNAVESIQPLLMLVEGIILTIWVPHLIKENINKEVLFYKFISIIVMMGGLYLITF